jgi:HK97 family phage portal protein
VTTLIESNGRLLRRAAPAGINGLQPSGGLFSPMWTNGAGEGVDDCDSDGFTISYGGIYESQPVVAAAVNKLTRQGAALPLKIYKRGSDNDHERQRDIPLDALLQRPWPRMAPIQLKQWALLPLLVHGNSVIAKWRQDPEGPPTGLFPLDYRYLEPYASKGGTVDVWVTTQFDEPRWLVAEDVIHFRWDSPNGPLGISPLKQLGTTIRMEDAAQRYQTANFRNGIRPSAGMTVPPDVNLNDPTVRQFFREQIEAIHKGVDRAGKLALLPPGATITPLSFSAVEAQLIQQRKLNREEVEFVYDLAGPLLGDLEHGTYSNVSELHKQLYKSVLRPWLTLIEETLQAQLIDPEPEWRDLFVEFDYAEQLRGDPLQMAQAIQTEISSGTLTPNEARKLQNRPRVAEPDADKLYLPQNNLVPLGETPATPAETPPVETPPALP